MGWGDELMAAGQARAVHAATGRRVQVLDRLKAPRWHLMWEGLDYIARPGEPGNFERILNGSGARPYHTGKFVNKWTYNLAHRAVPAEIRFTAKELEFGRRHAGKIILELHIKGNASPNKQWGWVRWNKLAWLMGRRGLRYAQVGGPDTPLLDNAEHILTPDFRSACAVLATARAAVLPEGGLHHAAAAVGLPAVVIFGGFTPIEVTGYDLHINLGASGEEACGMRFTCPHCESWMASITPEQVIENLENILGSNPTGNQAMARPVAA